MRAALRWLRLEEQGALAVPVALIVAFLALRCPVLALLVFLCERGISLGQAILTARHAAKALEQGTTAAQEEILAKVAALDRRVKELATPEREHALAMMGRRGL